MPSILILNNPLSGVNQYLFSALKSKGWNLTIVNVPQRRIYKYTALVASFQPNVRKWIANAEVRLGKIYKSPSVFLERTRYCEKIIEKFGSTTDMIFQMQGLFMPSRDIEKLKIPYVVATDYTIQLAEKYPPWVPFESHKEKRILLESRLYHNAKRIFTWSENTRQSLIRDYGVDESRVVRTYIGVPWNQLPNQVIRKNDSHVLFIGYEFERKGGFDLLKAFREVRKIIPDATLTIVGPRRFTHKIHEPGVKMFGPVHNRDVIQTLYAQASVFVMPSFCEPFGLVFLEAMAYGIPCIGSDIDAMHEIVVEGETGFLVPPGNVEALSKRIITLLQNPALNKRMGEAGGQRVRKIFNWDKVAEVIDIHLRRIMKP